MSELVWFLVPLGAILWMAGGTWWKPARRWVYPFLLTFGVWHGAAGWPLAAWCLSTVLMTHCGYGDSTSWWGRVGVSVAYGATVLWFGWGSVSWAILLALSFIGLLWLSRRFNHFPHKLVEMLHGFLHALATVWLVTH